jgi:hypothetical protein
MSPDGYSRDPGLMGEWDTYRIVGADMSQHGSSSSRLSNCVNPIKMEMLYTFFQFDSTGFDSTLDYEMPFYTCDSSTDVIPKDFLYCDESPPG